MIKTEDEAADALRHVIQDVADPKGTCIARLGAMGEAHSREGFKHWRNHIESRLRLTHRISLQQILSQSVVLAPSLVLRTAYF